MGWVPQKSAGFGATAPAQKHPRSRCGTKKHSICTIFIEFGDTKKCCTFSGLELAPKSRKKLIGALSCMHKGPKCIQSLWDYPKKIPFVQKHKEGAICAILRWKNPFLAFPEAKKLSGALSCMHKGLKCIHSLWDHPKKIPFVQKHKEGAICAILREKTHFWHSQRLKKVLLTAQGCARLRKAAHWPNNNANPSGLSEKKVYCVEKRDMCDSLGKKPHFWPSQRLKKLSGALSCMHTGPKCIQSLWDHPKKIHFVQKHKEGAICAILTENTPFWPSQRLKKVLLTAQGCARLRTGPIIMQIPRGYQKKSVIV